MNFDPAVPGFFDPGALDRELPRAITDICHTCRRCYNLCPSFDVLFRALDRPEVDGEIDRLPSADLTRFHGPLLRMQALHPALPVLSAAPLGRRHPASRPARPRRRVREPKEGRPFRERILATPDALGRLCDLRGARRQLRCTESRFALGRWRRRSACIGTGCCRPSTARRSTSGGERAGRRDRRSSTSRRARRRRPLRHLLRQRNSAPEIGKAAVAVLEKNGCRGRRPVPAVLRDAVPRARRPRLGAREPPRQRLDAAALRPRGVHDRLAGPDLLASRSRRSTRFSARKGRPDEVAARDAGPLRVPHAPPRCGQALDRLPERSPGKIVYHVPCHLKVQDIGFKSRDLLALDPGQPRSRPSRSAPATTGPGAMKTEYFPISRWRSASRVFDAVTRERPDARRDRLSPGGTPDPAGHGRSPAPSDPDRGRSYGLRVEG